jgi:predicted transcriptional regulator
MQMPKETFLDRNEILTLTVEIVSASAGNNALDQAAMPDLIGSVFAKLNELATEEKPLPETLTPAVPIREVGHGRLHRLSRGWKEAEDAEAASDDRPRHVT